MNKSEWISENPYKPEINKVWANQLSFLAFKEGGEAYTKTLIEWLEGNCPHYIKKYDGEPESMPRRMCSECMQELRLSL